VTVLVALGVLLRPAGFGVLTMTPIVACGLVTFGGAEFVREGLRKPYVIGEFMFVNGVRLPVHWAASTDRGRAGAVNDDLFTIDRLEQNGLLATAKFVRAHTEGLPAGDVVAHQEARGRAVFTLLCVTCHTLDGHLAIRPLVQGRPVAALEGVLGRLASPVDACGQPATWSTPRVRLATWRGRRMPPFVGTDAEKHDLAVYLARLGGATPAHVAETQAGGEAGKGYVDEHCAMCHADDGQWPMSKRPHRSVDEFYELLGRLPEVNEMMPPFAGDDAQRRAVASYLAAITSASAKDSK
jgi:mono/diheme cytochrome c family protein